MILKGFKKVIEFPIIEGMAWLWSTVHFIFRFSYFTGRKRSKSLGIPTISVGNLSFGGTGKTPFVIWLLNRLEDRGFRNMVLTRGYRGKSEKGRVCLRSGDLFKPSSALTGDEPYLLAQRSKYSSIVIGRNRLKNFQYFAESERPDLVILDDGFQHLKIKRDFEILLFDATMDLSRYYPAPKGYLREKIEMAKLADLVVITRCDRIAKDQLDRLKKFIGRYVHPQTLVLESRYRTTGLYDLFCREQTELNLRGLKVIVMTAIANPASFVSGLIAEGVEVVENIFFPDHHYFTINELKQVLEKAESLGAYILCTEKDVVKLKNLTRSNRIVFARIDLDFMGAEELLLDQVFTQLGQRVGVGEFTFNFKRPPSGLFPEPSTDIQGTGIQASEESSSQNLNKQERAEA